MGPLAEDRGQSATCLEAIHTFPLQPFHELPDCPTSHGFPPSLSPYSWCPENSHCGSTSPSALSLCLPKCRAPVERNPSSVCRCPHLIPGDLRVLVIISHPNHFKRTPPPTILFTGLIYSAFKRDSPTHPVTRTSSRMFSLVPLPPPSCFALSHLTGGMPCGHCLNTRLGPAGARCSVTQWGWHSRVGGRN